MSRPRKFREYLIERLQSSEEAAAYLSVALEEYEVDHDAKAFFLALRTVVEAQGGISELTKKTKLNRQHLYKVLSGAGNPRWSTLGSILSGLGLRIRIDTVGDQEATVQG